MDRGGHGWELSPRLLDGCILTAGSGSSTNWYAREVKLREGMLASLSGTVATMGSGVPYALAATLAHPDRAVIALVGDRAMQTNGMNKLLTVAKYRDRFADPCFVVLVTDNKDLNQVTWEMRALEGDPKWEASQDIPDFDYARFAELCGLLGIRVEPRRGCAGVGRGARGRRAGGYRDAVVTRDVPPIPPHVEWKQATAMMTALMKGDPDAAHVARRSARQELLGWLPGRG